MAENKIKITLELLKEETIGKDILEKVTELKGKMKELEDAATAIAMKNDIKNEGVDRLRTKKSETIQARSNLPSAKCKYCSESFKVISDLEKHIKKEHIDFNLYECEICRKRFVTKWRQEKHMNIHLNTPIRHCKYYMNDTFCPFDDLGCKFKHENNIQKRQTKTEDVKEAIERNESMNIFKNWTFNTLTPQQLGSKSKFYTSTPKKILKKCDGCVSSSECVNCVMRHVLAGHGDYTWR